MHPMIAQEAIESAHQLAQTQGLHYLIYEVPLLTESGFWTDRLDWVVVVDCSRQTQVERVTSRSPHLGRQMIESMIDAQAQPEARRNIANVLINNDKNETNRLNLAVQVDILTQHVGLLKK